MKNHQIGSRRTFHSWFNREAIKRNRSKRFETVYIHNSQDKKWIDLTHGNVIREREKVNASMCLISKTKQRVCCAGRYKELSSGKGQATQAMTKSSHVHVQWSLAKHFIRTPRFAYTVFDAYLRRSQNWQINRVLVGQPAFESKVFLSTKNLQVLGCDFDSYPRITGNIMWYSLVPWFSIGPPSLNLFFIHLIAHRWLGSCFSNTRSSYWIGLDWTMLHYQNENCGHLGIRLRIASVRSNRFPPGIVHGLKLK